MPRDCLSPWCQVEKRWCLRMLWMYSSERTQNVESPDASLAKCHGIAVLADAADAAAVVANSRSSKQLLHAPTGQFSAWRFLWHGSFCALQACIESVQMVAIETVLTQTSIFVSSTSNFNIFACPPDDMNVTFLNPDRANCFRRCSFQYARTCIPGCQHSHATERASPGLNDNNLRYTNSFVTHDAVPAQHEPS